ncbi:MAG: hypothetical protein ACOZNI_07885 [Myxococcota bacterium]
MIPENEDRIALLDAATETPEERRKAESLPRGPITLHWSPKLTEPGATELAVAMNRNVRDLGA